MSPTLTTFLYEAANFLILAAVLGHFFFRPIRQALADHRAQIDRDTQAAQERLATAEEIRSAIEAERTKLHQELEVLRTQALEAVRKEAGEIIVQAHSGAQRLDKARAQHAARLDEAQTARLARAVCSAAGTAVDRLLKQLGERDLHAALVQAAAQRVRDMTFDAEAAVTIESSLPVEDENRQILDDALGPAAEHAKRRTVPDLGAGVRIATSGGLIDATVAGLADFAAQALREELQTPSAGEAGNG